MHRHMHGLEVSLAGVTDLSAEEMSHVAGIFHRQQGTVNESAFRDCVRTLRAECRSGKVSNDDDLLALRNQMLERKGTKP